MGIIGLAARLAVSLGLLVAAVVPAQAGTLDRARAAGELKLGYRSDARPFSYEEAGGPVGYSVELCQEIARAAGLKATFVPVRGAEQFEAVARGRIDLMCGAASVTLSRREDVSFSTPIFPGGIGALVRTDAPQRMRAILSGEPEPYRPRWRASLGQILNKRIFAVRRNTTAATWLADSFDEFGIVAEMKPVGGYEEGVADVVAGRADVMFGEQAILLDTAHRSPNADELMVIPRHFTLEPIAFALARGDEEFRLLVDRTLAAFHESGAMMKLYADFFGAPSEDAALFMDMATLPE